MKKRIIVKGPALSRSGYGEQCRFALRSLRAHEEKFDIHIRNTNWGNTGWTHEDDEERKWLDEVLQKTAIYDNQTRDLPVTEQYDMSLQVTIPNEWEKLSAYDVGYTAGIETTRIAPAWIVKSEIVDKIVVVSNHAKEVFEKTSYQATNGNNGEVVDDFRCRKEIEVVNYAVRNFDKQDVDLDFSTDFNFLTMAQIGPRKNLDNTILWFVDEFKNDENVGLVVKGFIGKNNQYDRDATANHINNLLARFPERKCKVYLLHGHMTNEELTGLYQHPKIKCMVTLTHGEGYGLPLFEAAYNALPVLAPAWSGHLDFLYMKTKDKKKPKKTKNKAMFGKISYTLGPIPPHAVWEGVLEKDSMWCYPEPGSYKMRLRDVCDEYTRYKSTAKKLQTHLKEEFSEQKMYKKFVDAVWPFEEQSVENWLSEMDEKVFD